LAPPGIGLVDKVQNENSQKHQSQQGNRAGVSRRGHTHYKIVIVVHIILESSIQSML
jgi:hypothetical protein